MDRRLLVDFRENESWIPERKLYVTVDGEREGYRDIVSAKAERGSEFDSRWVFVVRLGDQVRSQAQEYDDPHLALGWKYGRLDEALEKAEEATPAWERMPVVFVDSDGVEIEFVESGLHCGPDCVADCESDVDAGECEAWFICRRIKPPSEGEQVTGFASA